MRSRVLEQKMAQKPERVRKPERLKNVWDPIHFFVFCKNYYSPEKNVENKKKKLSMTNGVKL